MSQDRIVPELAKRSIHETHNPKHIKASSVGKVVSFQTFQVRKNAEICANSLKSILKNAGKKLSKIKSSGRNYKHTVNFASPIAEVKSIEETDSEDDSDTLILTPDVTKVVAKNFILERDESGDQKVPNMSHKETYECCSTLEPLPKKFRSEHYTDQTISSFKDRAISQDMPVFCFPKPIVLKSELSLSLLQLQTNGTDEALSCNCTAPDVYVVSSHSENTGYISEVPETQTLNEAYSETSSSDTFGESDGCKEDAATKIQTLKAPCIEGSSWSEFEESDLSKIAFPPEIQSTSTPCSERNSSDKFEESNIWKENAVPESQTFCQTQKSNATCSKASSCATFKLKSDGCREDAATEIQTVHAACIEGSSRSEFKENDQSKEAFAPEIQTISAACSEANTENKFGESNEFKEVAAPEIQTIKAACSEASSGEKFEGSSKDKFEESDEFKEAAAPKTQTLNEACSERSSGDTFLESDDCKEIAVPETRGFCAIGKPDKAEVIIITENRLVTMEKVDKISHHPESIFQTSEDQVRIIRNSPQESISVQVVPCISSLKDIVCRNPFHISKTSIRTSFCASVHSFLATALIEEVRLSVLSYIEIKIRCLASF